jgi:hypothetical protein
MIQKADRDVHSANMTVDNMWSYGGTRERLEAPVFRSGRYKVLARTEKKGRACLKA